MMGIGKTKSGTYSSQILAMHIKQQKMQKWFTLFDGEITAHDMEK